MAHYYFEAPPIIRDFLTYHQTIQGHSQLTIEEYFLDLRNFFRFLKLHRGVIPEDTPFEYIPIDDISLEWVGSVSLSDLYAYLNYLTQSRAIYPNSPKEYIGLSPSSRARKISSIRSFYRYLTHKAKVLEKNPMLEFGSPPTQKSLPRYLDLQESILLLQSVTGPNQIRDYCILTLFLNCGLCISELIGLNLSDFTGEQLRILGRGKRERTLYVNEACQSALKDWLAERETIPLLGEQALFVTKQHKMRISRAAVHKLVKKHLAMAGLDSSQYSSHNLRHTAATLMLQHGVDLPTLQEVLGHHHLNTTQLYTHVKQEDLRLATQATPLSRIKKKTPSASE